MAKLTVNEITSGIVGNDWTNADLDAMIMAVKFARGRLGRKNKYSFARGDKVKFTSRGRLYQGVVERVLVKNIVVKTTLGPAYRVPANMLEAA